jgi:amino acid adenylation domain-containing protein
MPATLLPQLERQARERPDAIAVVSDGRALSYATLHQRANRLAHLLRAQGVAADVPVAVCLPRTAELLVALLAVWKAGGAYVPLDPHAPAARLAYLVGDAGAPVLIATSALGDAIPRGDEHRIDLDTAIEAIEPAEAIEMGSSVRDNGDVRTRPPGPEETPAVAASVLAAPVHGDNLAYIIYTSGSTGQPKGVGVTHRNIATLLAASDPLFGFDSQDTWTLFHSAGFDFSVWEMWGALAYGGKLIVIANDLARQPDALAALLRDERVTVLNQTPSAFRALQAMEASASIDTLRYVIFGGEALAFESLRPWVARHGVARPALINMYGITETTVHVTHHAVQAADVADASGSRIGRPLPHLQMYLLDQALQLVPVGVPGEIYVGGLGVARGYLGRPELTATRFVPDPFGSTPGARLYRAGDLARWRADGTGECLGRSDQQVKLHGYRIEPAEIEAALREQPGVRDAVVVLRDAASTEARLVAYVVPDPTETMRADQLLTDRLQAALGRVLPAYMVPSVIVPIEALPLTPHGKIDRTALPAPAGARPTLGSAYAAPRTAFEATMAQVWADVLHVDRVGIHDNFFALGGDSMRTIQVQAAARERGVDVSLAQLMRDQTIAELAARMQTESAEAIAGPSVAIVTRPFDLVSPDDRARLPIDVDDAYPLTELQAGMLFHSELDPASALYHDVLSYHVRVPADEATLSAALGDVVAAHPMLRTSLHLSGYSEPLQLVHRHGELPLQMEDWRHLAAADQDRALEEWFAAQRRLRFEWARAPLFRLCVHRRTDDTIQCTLVCHHAILDGWSVAAFFTELFTRYVARLRGDAASVLEPPKTTFRDYVALERASLKGTADRDYWVGHLADSVPTIVPRWPDRAPRAAGPAVTTATVRLTPEVSAGLAGVAARVGVPLKTVLLAGHLRVLALVANVRDAVTGVVTHGRPGTMDADRMLGLFLNTLPLRVRVEGSWLDLTQRLFAIEREQAAHRYFPMPTLLRETGGQPLFEAAFNFIHFHVYQALVGIQDVEVLDGQSRAETNFPLLLQCTLHGATGDIDLQLDAHRAEFSDEQVRQLLAYYERAYAAMAADPAQPCTATLLTPAERAQVLHDWNRTEVPHRLDRTVQDLVERHAQSTPETTAVTDGRQHLSYGDLWRRVDDLASTLVQLGAGPDICVGVCLPRSVEAAIGILATLRAGSAYVPLDQSYPDERLALMAEDASLRILLTTPALAARLGTIASEMTLVCLDGATTTVTRPAPLDDAATSSSSLTLAVQSQPSSRVPYPRVDAQNLAYVMYTSGSTGRPKGIGLPHRCLTNLIEWHLRTLRGGARTLQFASLGFDASFHEMMAALCAGDTLFIVPDEIRADAQALARALHEQAIEKAVLPPVVLQQIAEHCGRTPALLGSLRQIITTGEQLRLTQPVIELMTALPACELHNHYGPAETHVVTAAVYGDAPRSWRMLPPIGIPIDNTQIYILDRQFAAVPVATPGELYIGGVSLARGYSNRPDLTAEKFVPDPFSAAAGERLYRTGDLARWLPDGQLEFLGRIATRQVKLRGFRVELGEVEAAISRHPGVRTVVVLVREYGAGSGSRSGDGSGADDRRLVAYIIPSQAEPPTTSDLRAFLGRTLPAFMIPAAFVALPAFPLTTNGKIDRRQLPDPQTVGRPDLADDYVAPRTPAEELVAGIYQQVLGVDRLGVLDDFFERGGHSILATQAIVRVREAFGTDLPLRVLFERPTVAGLVLALAETLGGAAVIDEIAATVLEVERLSDDEVRARVAADTIASTASTAV